MSEDETGLADRVIRTGEDEIALRFTSRERAIIGALLQDLEAVLPAPPADDDADDIAEDDVAGDDTADDLADDAAPDPDVAVRARLYPTAIPDDERADASFRRLVHADLEAGRRERLAVVVATLDARTIDEWEEFLGHHLGDR